MHPYPHHYIVRAEGGPDGRVAVNATGLPEIETAPPVEFDGPGGTWSPETLLCASVADCFILTFRALAKISKLEWTELALPVRGQARRVEGVTRFTGFHDACAPRASREDADPGTAKTLLEKAEQKCLITNSLNGTQTLEAEVAVAG